MMLSLTFARRELRSGTKGFRIFLACLALGVAALAAAGSTAEAFRQGLASQARSILGGDIAISVEGRRFSATEQAAFQHLGRTSDRVHVRAMAATLDGTGNRRLVEVSGVDDAYPLAGTVELSGARDLVQATATQAGVPGAAVAPELLERLHLRLGDRVMIGETLFRVSALVVKEPDTLARGFALGPRVIVSRDALVNSGLVAGDTLFGEAVTVALPPTTTTDQALQQVKRDFPHAGFQAKGRNDAVSGVGQLINRLEFFLSFIGLASLLAGGLGVSSAVSAYLGDRRPAIAVLKALGADGALIRNTYLLQLGVLTAIGIAIGLAVGALAPLILGLVAGNRFPIPVLFALYPLPLLRAAAYGGLAAVVFSLGPLARARSTPPAALFRQDLAGRLTFGPEVVAIILSVIGLFGLTAVTASSPIVAAIMLVGLLLAFAVLWLLGQGIVRVAAFLRRYCAGFIRIGLANLSGPRSAARTASPAMGFGIALLTTIILIQSSLLAQVTSAAGKTAPSIIFTQIAPEDGQAFDSLVASAMGRLTDTTYRRYPFATGRITQLHGQPVHREAMAEKDRWAFDQDITLSALAAAPPEAHLLQGRWWAADYAGPPQVIIDDDIARGGKLKIGDTLTVSILGRDLDATVAGIRKIDFGQFGANFPVIIDAHALDGANLRDIAIAKATRAQESVMTTRLGQAFPAINIISVREQLEAAATIFDQIGWAVRGAAAVAALASLLVLAGAIAASAPAREREAALLKVLGASRGFIIAAYGVEYGAVSLLAGLTGVGVGAASAWPVIVLAFHAPWTANWLLIMDVLAGVLILGIGIGAAGAAAALSKRPAPALRSE